MPTDNITVIGNTHGEYNADTFLRLVQSEIEQRQDKTGLHVVNVLAVVMWQDGLLKLHSSTSDQERNLVLAALTSAHLVRDVGETFAQGFQPEPSTIK